jgi:hypothetical protein
MQAGQGGHIMSLHILRQRGADLHLVDEDGATAWLWYAWHGMTWHGMAWWLHAGRQAGLTSRSDVMGVVRCRAAQKGHAAALQYLHDEAGMPLDAVDHEGMTYACPCMGATRACFVFRVGSLSQAGGAHTARCTGRRFRDG